MKEMYICDRCGADLTIPISKPSLDHMKRLGWIKIPFRRKDLTICPHCAHELKRFFGGCEIKKLVRGKGVGGEDGSLS